MRFTKKEDIEKFLYFVKSGAPLKAYRHLGLSSKDELLSEVTNIRKYEEFLSELGKYAESIEDIEEVIVLDEIDDVKPKKEKKNARGSTGISRPIRIRNIKESESE